MKSRKRINTKSINVKVIKPETIEVINPFGKSCGHLNEMEVLHLRCQIKNARQWGYYFYYKGEKIEIKNDGMFSKHIDLFTSDIPMRNYLLGIDNQLYLSEIKSND